VERAIFRTMEKTQHPNVYLDLAHLDPAMVLRRFPGINRVCLKFGLDITKDRVPVRPGAHYMIGGATVDRQGRTTLPGLWAAGEVSSSGLHGANRLASNSLIEGLVYGTLCARGATEAARKISRDFTAHPLRYTIPQPDADDRLDVLDLTASLRSLMVRKMGIVRERARLLEAQADVGFWCRYALTREIDSRAGWELQNLLTIAKLMVDAALRRDESRGTHFRGDFPARDDARWGQRRVVAPATDHPSDLTNPPTEQSRLNPVPIASPEHTEEEF
jgi:L-aspartate oxidase